MNDDRGFVKVDCKRCANPDVWLKCESCKKSDHFVIRDAVGPETAASPTLVDCDCKATYAFATCTCGEQVPMERLRFVRWDRGPKQLADLEVAWGRIAAMAAAAVTALGVALWFVWK